VRFTCLSCGRTYIVASELSGLAFKMKCKTCGQVIEVRPAAAPAPPPAQAEIPAPTAKAAPALAPTEPPVPTVSAAPAEALASREAERPEAAARPADPDPPRRRNRRGPSPRLLRPTFVLSAILAALVAVYFFLIRDPGAKRAQSSVGAPVQAAPRPEPSAEPRQAAPAPEPAPPRAAPSPDPADLPTTAGARLPRR
jgi:predicted Zn finger-like uncharacterized protein